LTELDPFHLHSIPRQNRPIRTLPKKDLKLFLQKIQEDKNLLNKVKFVATANEIAEIAATFGYQFSGEELKSISKENIPGVKVNTQDTSPSYSFGESGN
tara:strand:+ start:1340 stop:1636 length:297 start_codon:yes stop_codon:yes gene_type:complete